MSNDFDLEEWMVENNQKRGTEWEVYRGRADNENCDIRLKSGVEIGPCWPSVGHFVDLSSDDYRKIPSKDVSHIRYYEMGAEVEGNDDDEAEDDE